MTRYLSLIALVVCFLWVALFYPVKDDAPNVEVER